MHSCCSVVCSIRSCPVIQSFGLFKSVNKGWSITSFHRCRFGSFDMACASASRLFFDASANFRTGHLGAASPDRVTTYNRGRCIAHTDAFKNAHAKAVLFNSANRSRAPGSRIRRNKSTNPAGDDDDTGCGPGALLVPTKAASISSDSANSPSIPGSNQFEPQRHRDTEKKPLCEFFSVLCVCRGPNEWYAERIIYGRWASLCQQSTQGPIMKTVIRLVIVFAAIWIPILLIGVVGSELLFPNDDGRAYMLGKTCGTVGCILSLIGFIVVLTKAGQPSRPKTHDDDESTH